MITFIALGSNLGDSMYYIHAAIDIVSKRIGKVLKQSSVISTKAYGYEDQPDFLNAVIKVDTELEPLELLKELKNIEKDLDRKKTFRWGPRTIDLDIILYEDIVFDSDILHIPHIDFLNRRFVIEPLKEIEENIINPRTKEKI